MSDVYRLAVIEDGGVALPVVEQGGRLLPLAQVLGADAGALAAGTDLMPLLQDWTAASQALDAAVAAANFSGGRSAGEAKFRAPLALPGKIVCIGANYHDHVAEMPIPMVPEYPYAFLKPANTTIRGSGDPVARPPGVSLMDYEAELAVVIGTECRHVAAAEALDVIAGYANLNDLSARDWLASRPPIGVDWVRHKAFDGFCPFGPYLLPARFVADPQNVDVHLTVNGVTKQDTNTRHMIYGVAAIIEHLSAIMTLLPGDVIATGTGAGVGHGRKPPEYLKPGDEVVIEIAGLGRLITPIV
ncbi:fumarylacetoacetate hydrolase family protein [Sphingomonas profundi]|uniref:fumarylacetoacetate hydrolase family protein n=1 Tax=Alterirhizorhabdus profundi TaxID=2681549 RepID=UPI0012E8A569|nr:fumarylacetoacetate hydrolase family protein [Sphingomonas profundi]